MTDKARNNTDIVDAIIRAIVIDQLWYHFLNCAWFCARSRKKHTSGTNCINVPVSPNAECHNWLVVCVNGCNEKKVAYHHFGELLIIGCTGSCHFPGQLPMQLVVKMRWSWFGGYSVNPFWLDQNRNHYQNHECLIRSEFPEPNLDSWNETSHGGGLVGFKMTDNKGQVLVETSDNLFYQFHILTVKMLE